MAYTCVTNPFTGRRVCLRIYQIRYDDGWYANTSDDSTPCLLSGLAIYQYPYEINIRVVVGSPYAALGFESSTDTDRLMFPSWLPWNCWYGWCSLAGSTQVLAWLPGYGSDFHFRPYFMTVSY